MPDFSLSAHFLKGRHACQSRVSCVSLQISQALFIQAAPGIVPRQLSENTLDSNVPLLHSLDLGKNVS